MVERNCIAIHARTGSMRDWQACRACGATAIELHHCFYGTANRKLSDKYNLVIWLCRDCHKRMHSDKAFRQKYQKMAKAKFEREHPELSFYAVFGKYEF
jgi:hypothetical protein